MSGCNPDTILHNHKHAHSLLCDHHAFFDKRQGKVVYLHDDEMHENCENGHTHRSQICLKHEFSKVVGPDEDCSQRDDCHIHIRDDGAAELHHPATDPKTGKRVCETVTVLTPLT